MKGRRLVVVVGLILTMATVGMLGFARRFDDDVRHGRTLVAVIVSEVDIPARTDLDQLIKDDQFRIIQVPPGVVVDGAVTSIDQLSDRHVTALILAGEQIPIARIKA